MTAAFRIHTCDTVASTNDEAMARLKAGDPGGFVVTARSQTGGRGRQGRAWASPPGNLYASFGLLDPAPVAVAPQLGFVAGIALARTLRARLDSASHLKIKWPNDMMVAGAKLAGILLESATLRGGALACVIGVGVNIRSHPEGLPYPATDLRAAGDAAAEPDTVLTALADALTDQLEIWRGGAGFAEIRAAWLDLAAGLGQRITVAMPRGAPSTGLFQGLDPNGRLMLETDTGRVIVDAGDVFLPGATAGAMEA